MTANLPLPMTYADSKELEKIIDAAVVRAVITAVAWRAVPPPPPFTDEELAASTPPGEKTRRRGKSQAPIGTFPDPPPPRYAPEVIAQEIAMILYRLACRSGLHQTGIEVILARGIDRLEEELLAVQLDPREIVSAIMNLMAAESVRDSERAADTSP